MALLPSFRLHKSTPHAHAGWCVNLLQVPAPDSGTPSGLLPSHTSVFLHHCLLPTKCKMPKGGVCILLLFIDKSLPSWTSAWHLFDYLNISQMNEEKNWFSGLLHLVTWIGRCIWAMCLGSDFETSTICWPVPCFAVLGERSLPLDCSLDSRTQPAKHILCSTQD